MLFKILHGDDANISIDITPFHEGYCYVTHQGYMYIDMNVGTKEAPNNQRIKLNANQAESLVGCSIATILNSSDIEIPTSKAVLDALNEIHAIIGTDDSIVGTWVLNDEIPLPNADDYLELDFVFNSNGVSWNDMEIYSEGILYGNPDTDEKVFSPDTGWQGEEFKTIQILKEPSAEVAAWLRANAKKQSQTILKRLDTLETSAQTPITYAELKSLRDNSQLVPGMFYRITDYQCTTVQENTRAANNQFDIVVQSLEVNKLSENASAAWHEGDTYFTDVNLATWEIKYCLDNDTDRFNWADEENGRGVIYYLKDDHNNECPYDFKNIQFKRWKGDIVSEGSDNYVNLVNLYNYFGPDYYDSDYMMDKAQTYYDILRSMTKYNISNLGGFLYSLGLDGEYKRVGDLEYEDETLYNYLIDGTNYSLSDDDYIVTTGYDDNEGVNISYMVINNSVDYWFYTFSYGVINNSTGGFSDITDTSITSENVYNNKLKAVDGGNGVEQLSANVFLGNDCHSNTFGENCFENTFGNGCYSNTFGGNCYSNTFGNNCSSNTFGSDCYSNTFGDNCCYNTFGYNCFSNTFSNIYMYNAFGNNCSSNTFGYDCYSNTFGDNCCYNTFGYAFVSNTFGYAFDFNTFGYGCCYNTFGNDCYNNTFGNHCDSNTFGDAIYEKTFGDNLANYNSKLLINITYSELKQLRDNNQLSPGRFYRITDYVCTTVQENTRAMNNQFDIIVQALSNNTLSENASADYHMGVVNTSDMDEAVFPAGLINPIYYEYIDFSGGAGEGLAEYKHSDVFIAFNYRDDTPDGEMTPVIYKTDKESYLSEGADYADAFYYIGTAEVDGITYDKWRKISPNLDDPDTHLDWDSDGQIYLYTNVVVENGRIALEYTSSGISADVANIPAWEIKYCLDNDTTRFAWADEENGKGVIYYMKDEHGNECPYDFKNIQFRRDGDWQSDHMTFIVNLGLNLGEVQWFYTFSWINENFGVEDLTVKQDLVDDGGDAQGTYGNIVLPRKQKSGAIELNNNIFINSNQYDFFYGCYANNLGANCRSNTFGHQSNENTFGNNCYENTFGNNFNFNTFGNNCYSNTLGEGCGTNTFGNYCHKNTFGDNCGSNTFGNEFDFNTFGNNCYGNTLGNYCSNNTFGDDYSRNTFGNACIKNTFGDNCENNTFGDGCSNNTFGDNCENNTFGNNCESNTFGNGFYSNILKNSCTNNEFGGDSYFNTLNNECRENTFGYACYSNTLGHSCNENAFGEDCYSNTFGNDCFQNTLGDYCVENTFGDCLTSNTFGYNHCRNTFGNNCYNNTFGNNCYDNTFGNNCYKNTFGNDCGDNTFGNYCYDNTFGNIFNFNTFGNDCYSNTLGNSKTDPISYVQYIRFVEGVQNIKLINTETGDESNYVQDVVVSAGVRGTEDSPLELQVSRNAAPVVFEAAGTTHIILD